MELRKPCTWLNAIERILLAAERPMDANAIARSAINQQFVRSFELSPGESVRVAINRHITDENNDRGFVVTGSKFDRRYTLVDNPKLRARFRTKHEATEAATFEHAN